MSKRILTGIKPTGVPHLGNYFGTIAPALRRLKEYDESFMFVANLHALNQIQDAEQLKQNTLSITATWLACGLDPSQTHLYLQSDIPEDQVLATMLNSFTPKGWMNKAHAYKAASDQNEAEHKHVDDGINMGLYTYPVLMAADILVFDANTIPVGKDQVQHVEIARDIAQKINHQYGEDIFVLPEYSIEEDVQTIIGLDGRKMSKSYNNVIPIFCSPEERHAITKRIVTDSSGVGDKKQVEGTALYSLYCLVATEEEAASFKLNLETGNMGWGDAKAQLADKLEETFGSMTQRYNELMANPNQIMTILETSAEHVRPIAQAVLARLKAKTGVTL